MKQVVVYGLLVLMSLLLLGTEKACGRSKNCQSMTILDRIEANGCYTTSDYLFDNESGELAPALDHFTSDHKYFLILSGIRLMDKNCHADKVSAVGTIPDGDLSELAVYSVFGLHQIIV